MCSAGGVAERDGGGAHDRDGELRETARDVLSMPPAAQAGRLKAEDTVSDT